MEHVNLYIDTHKHGYPVNVYIDTHYLLITSIIQWKSRLIYTHGADLKVMCVEYDKYNERTWLIEKRYIHTLLERITCAYWMCTNMYVVIK